MRLRKFLTTKISRFTVPPVGLADCLCCNYYILAWVKRAFLFVCKLIDLLQLTFHLAGQPLKIAVEDLVVIPYFESWYSWWNYEDDLDVFLHTTPELLRPICYGVELQQYYTSTPFPVSEIPNTKIACRLVKHLLWGRSAGLDFDDNECVKPYHDLSPFVASVDQFPDAYIIDRESEQPLCTFEVHSGHQYDCSVVKTIIGVATPLRLLRHKADIDSCIGFTFPGLVRRVLSPR